MKLTIRTRHLSVPETTSAEIRRRLLRVLQRVAPRLHAVDVTITDINGPKGGADKQCRLRVRGRSMPTIVVEHVGVDTVATVALAAERAEQAVLRQIGRRRIGTPSFAF